MEYRKTNVNKRAEYTFTFVTGEKVVIKEGDCTIVDHKKVTAEDIQELHRQDDRWIDNCVRNGRPKRTKEEKAEIEAWNEEHPERAIPDGWNASLEQFSDDEESIHEYSPIEHLIINRTHETNPAVELLHEIIDEMPEKTRFCLIRTKLQGYTREEVAKELGCTIRTIAHHLVKAFEYIRANEDRFNFR